MGRRRGRRALGCCVLVVASTSTTGVVAFRVARLETKNGGHRNVQSHSRRLADSSSSASHRHPFIFSSSLKGASGATRRHRLFSSHVVRRAERETASTGPREPLPGSSTTNGNSSPLDANNGLSSNGMSSRPYGYHGVPVELPIAFQGEFGAYSEEAAFQHFGPSATTLPCRSFDEVFDAVESGRAAYGMLPMENSQAGSINKSYDLLMEYDLRVHGETTLRVKHALLALPLEESSPSSSSKSSSKSSSSASEQPTSPPTTAASSLQTTPTTASSSLKTTPSLSSIRRVRSHPQALAQCERYLAANGLAIEAGSDTAGSAREIAENRLEGVAAICSRLAAARYGLAVLATGIEDNKFNFTRFFVIGRGAFDRPITKPKTSVVFAVSDKPGSLVAALSEFGRRTVNIIKLESRPRRRYVTPGFFYTFYLDFEGHHADPGPAAALMSLLESCAFVKLLGTYERGPTPRAMFAGTENGLGTDVTLDPALMQI